MRPDRLRSLDWIVLLAMGLSIRILLIGLEPYHDEGHYAAEAYFHYLNYTAGLFNPHAVLGFATGVNGALELYALLRSWIFFVPAEPLLLMRIIDGAIAASVGVVMYRYLALATGSRLPAFLACILVILAMNHHDFIEAGSRNPIPLATLLLFCSLYLLERDQGTRLVLPACCAALCVLVREPFAPFAVSVAAYVWYRHGFRTAISFCGVAAACGVAVFGAVAALKGGTSALAPMLRDYTQTMYSNPELGLDLQRRAARAVERSREMAALVPFVAPAFIAGLLAPLLDRTLRKEPLRGTYALGLTMMLAPWLEMLMKKAYTYHAAQMLIGASILVTFGFVLICRMVAQLFRERRLAGWAVAAALAFVHAVLLPGYARTMKYAAGWSLHFAPVMVLGNWNSPVVNDAYYLKLASLIRRYSTPADRILSTCSPPYPLAYRAPVTRETSDLNYYLLRARIAGTPLDELIARARQDRPPIFIQEHMPEMPQLNRDLETIRDKLRDLYPVSVEVGPGLPPYRAFSATVHISDRAALR